MNVVLFCHSLASCWNHGNAHFLRGVLRELKKRGHAVRVFEPEDGWSRQNLVADHGDKALNGLRTAYPELDSATYAGEPGLDQAVDGADLVLVHEWNPSSLVAVLGRRRRQGGRFVLLFHDTHHRAVTDPQSISGVQLDGYDGVLAFGACLRERYLAAGWASRVWIWHEARAYGGPWRGQAELLAIEPTSVPHPLGLAAAIEHGQALELGAGETAAHELRLAVSES